MTFVPFVTNVKRVGGIATAELHHRREIRLQPADHALQSPAIDPWVVRQRSAAKQRRRREEQTARAGP